MNNEHKILTPYLCILRSLSSVCASTYVCPTTHRLVMPNPIPPTTMVYSFRHHQQEDREGQKRRMVTSESVLTVGV